jgi:phosphoribosylamine---glycine ligase
MKLAGNEVKLWIEMDEYDDTLDGLIEKVFAWKPWVSWCDLVVYDQNSKVLASIHNQIGKTKPQFGGSEFGLKLEKDRKYGRKIMNDIGFEPLESIEFKTIPELVKHLKTHKVRHVVKPSGKEIKSHHVIIGECEDNEDVIALLEAFEGQNIPFDYIEAEERKIGIEIGCGSFSAGRGGLVSPDINFEHKHSATGAMGFLTGETGTVIKAVGQSNKFFRDTLMKVGPILEEEAYVGQIDINCILDPKTGEIAALEWTPRLGYPAIFIQDEAQELPWADLFMMLARQMSFDNIVSDDWTIGAVYMTPGFPSADEVKERSLGYPIFGADGGADGTNKHIHLLESKRLKDRLVTAKGLGMPFVVTASGATLKKAQKALYGLLDKGNDDRPWVPNGWYRIDIGDRVIDQLPDLERLGIIELTS